MSDLTDALNVIARTLEYQVTALNVRDFDVLAQEVGNALSRQGFAYYYQP